MGSARSGGRRETMDNSHYLLMRMRGTDDVAESPTSPGSSSLGHYGLRLFEPFHRLGRHCLRHIEVALVGEATGLLTLSRTKLRWSWIEPALGILGQARSTTVAGFQPHVFMGVPTSFDTKAPRGNSPLPWGS